MSGCGMAKKLIFQVDFMRFFDSLGDQFEIGVGRLGWLKGEHAKVFLA